LDLGTRHVVYVQKNENVYIPRNVQVGQTTPHYTEILEGISEDEPVVVAGTFLIDAQAQLRGEKPATPMPSPEKP
jgi:Cu(I)/Ag(I) efflux system membrane fusion protein